MTVKHFPGHGGEGDPHRGDTVDDDDARRSSQAADLVPFEALIQDGAEAVMVGHVTYPEMWGELPPASSRARTSCCAASASRASRSPTRSAWAPCTPASGSIEAPAMAVAAGADAVLVNQGDQVDAAARRPRRRRARGRLDEARLDEAVRPGPRAARPAARRHRLPHRLTRL